MSRDPRLLGYEEKQFLRTPKQPKPLKASKPKGDKAGEGFDPDYLAWIRKQPCIITGHRSGEWFVPHVDGSQVGARRRALVIAAHMKAGRTKGTDLTALPVDDYFHSAEFLYGQHRMGLRSWAIHFGLDLPALIAAHRKRFALEMAEKVKSK